MNKIFKFVDKYKPTKKTAITIVWGLIALVMYVLGTQGIEVEIAQEDVIKILENFAEVYFIFRAIWYNNSFTPKAKQADVYLDDLRMEDTEE